MKNSLLILLCVVLQSCNYFDAKKISKETIVDEQLKTFNWTDVDTYPSFIVCDSLTEKEDKKACFETGIANHFFTALNEESIMVNEEINETIRLHLLINQQWKVTLKRKDINEKTRQIIPNIDTLIINSIKSLPKIYPALKRGQQVQTQFVLPINLEMNSL